jgi:lipoate-protein ligase A
VKLSDQQILDIERIAANKYSTWDWNYGKSPVCNYHCIKRFDGGGIEVKMLIKNGLIEQCRIYGDFLSLINVVPIEKALTGSRYDRKTIDNIMKKFDLQLYFGEIATGDIISCFLME